MAESTRDASPTRTTFDDSPGSTHTMVLELVEPGARVLEFGCASGYMSQALRDRRGATVVGVELDAEAAQLAGAYTERILVGDAEELDLEAELGAERFDAIVFADVLEHLKEPKVQKLLEAVLSPEQFLVRSADDLNRALYHAWTKREAGKALIAWAGPE